MGHHKEDSTYFTKPQGRKIKIICVYPYPSVVLKKIPGGVKNVGDLCFQLKKPLFHRSQRHTEAHDAVSVARVAVAPER
jgi:hypothetical protein